MPTSADQERLCALRRYAILDTYPETPFERITRLAANIFGVPMALITLLDEDRQWFKSHYGVDACETPLGISFCAHAIAKDEVFIIPTATTDPRFADNPSVTGEPGVRVYAGAPLRTPGGARIGTLCIVDTMPRPGFQDTEQQILTDLAALVVDEMELRLASMQSSCAGNSAMENLVDLTAALSSAERRQPS